MCRHTFADFTRPNGVCVRHMTLLDFKQPTIEELVSRGRGLEGCNMRV